MANGSVDYSLGHLKSDVDTMKSDIKDLRRAVADLNAWKWKTVGAISSVALAGNLILKLIL